MYFILFCSVASLEICQPQIHALSNKIVILITTKVKRNITAHQKCSQTVDDPRAIFRFVQECVRKTQLSPYKKIFNDINSYCFL